MFGDTFGTLLKLSIIVTVLVNYLKPLWAGIGAVWKSRISYIVSTVLGIIVCVLSGADLFSSAGTPLFIPLVAQIISGIAVGGGSNVLYKISNSKTTDTAPPPELP